MNNVIPGRCSSCRYGETHDYLRTYYCNNKDCVVSRWGDIEEERDCDKWEENKDLRGFCNDCVYGTLNEETGKYRCDCIDKRNWNRGDEDVEPVEGWPCNFWSPKGKQ